MNNDPLTALLQDDQGAAERQEMLKDFHQLRRERNIANALRFIGKGPKDKTPKPVRAKLPNIERKTVVDAAEAEAKAAVVSFVKEQITIRQSMGLGFSKDNIIRGILNGFPFNIQVARQLYHQALNELRPHRRHKSKLSIDQLTA